MTKAQHTTPECYLKKFSEDGKKIWRKHKLVDKDQRLRNKELGRPISLRSATVVEDFYTLDRGIDPMLVETKYYANHVENEYTEIYNFLVNPDVHRFDMVHRRKLLVFFLTLHVRTPKQFDLFKSTVPVEFQPQIDQIKEDYKAAHILKVVPALLDAHEFKIVEVVRLIDSSEFITSDNPVLIVGNDGKLKNNDYGQQFATDNTFIIPIDKKHCIIFREGKDKNGIALKDKLFYNRIIRIDVDDNFSSTINLLMLDSADKYYFGTEEYMKFFFSVFKFV